MLKIHTLTREEPQIAERFLNLFARYGRDEMAMGPGAALPDGHALLESVYSRPWIRILLASLDTEAAGLCITIESFSTFQNRPVLNIHDLYVDPSYRRQGIAKGLLSATERLAIGLGCCKLTLEVLTRNSQAMSLYRSFGFGPYQLQGDQDTAEFWQKPA